MSGPALAMTGLREFWPDGRRVLLAQWCLRGARLEDVDSSAEVLPDPWDDRARVREARAYLGSLYESLLAALAEYLDRVHGTAHSPRYWRIVAGPWLLHALHAWYDRYVHLTDALARWPNLHTIGLESASFRIPATTADSLDALHTDSANLQVCTEILLGLSTAVEHRLPLVTPSSTLSSGRKGWRQLALSLERHTAACVIRCLRPRVLCADMYMPRQRLWSFFFRSRFRVALLPVYRDPVPVEPRMDEMRTGLASLPAHDTFSRIFAAALPRQVPVSLIENYAPYSRRASAAIRRVPDAVMSANGWYFNEPFKFAVAEAVERGAKLLCVQHGSGYGAYEVSWPERHEAAIADRYFVWGWAPRDAPTLRNLASPKLSRYLAPRHRNKSSRRILFVSTAAAYQMYLYRFDSYPLSGQWEEYVLWQERFLAALPDDIRRTLLFRSYQLPVERPVRARLARRFPDIGWGSGQPFERALSESDLVVVDHIGTTLLECLVSDTPTVAFWNPRRWELRADAERVASRLHDASVLCTQPESAARTVAAAASDPGAWWRDPARRAARREFIEAQALARPDWRRDWMSALEDAVRHDAVTDTRDFALHSNSRPTTVERSRI